MQQQDILGALPPSPWAVDSEPATAAVRALLVMSKPFRQPIPELQR